MDILKFSIKALILIAMLTAALFVLNYYKVIDLGPDPIKEELRRLKGQMENEASLANEAQEAIAAIWAAAKVQHAETGRWATKMNHLKRLNLEQVTLDRWNFALITGANGMQMIRGTSTSLMPGGAGKIVSFDAQRGRWSGYGFDY